jgi:hypothetical protein
MDQFRFKKRYALSKRTEFLLQASFYLVLVAGLRVIASIFMEPDRIYLHDAGAFTLILLCLIFCLIFALMCACFVLWIGMLLFLFDYDGRSPGYK